MQNKVCEQFGLNWTPLNTNMCILGPTGPFGGPNNCFWVKKCAKESPLYLKWAKLFFYHHLLSNWIIVCAFGDPQGALKSQNAGFFGQQVCKMLHFVPKCCCFSIIIKCSKKCATLLYWMGPFWIPIFAFWDPQGHLEGKIPIFGPKSVHKGLFFIQVEPSCCFSIIIITLFVPTGPIKGFHLSISLAPPNPTLTKLWPWAADRTWITMTSSNYCPMSEYKAGVGTQCNACSTTVCCPYNEVISQCVTSTAA